MSRISFLHPYALLLVPLVLGGMAFWWRRLGGALTLAVALCLCVAAARPQWAARAHRVARLYALDVSGSMFLDAPKALAAIRRSMGELGPGDKAGLLVFAASPLVLLPPAPRGALPPALELPGQPVRPDATDIAAAIRAAAQQLPDATFDRQLVLLSDGRATVPHVAELEAALAADAGLRVFAIPVGPEVVRDARIAFLRAPHRVRVGQPFALEATLVATAPMEAGFSLARDGSPLGEPRRVALEPGIPRRLALEDKLDAPGSALYTASLSVADRCAENNTVQALVVAEGATRVLYVAPGNPPLAGLLAATAGIQVKRLAPPEFRALAAALPGADCLVLEGVGADELPPAAHRAVRDWVRDAAGGLIAIGGTASFGPGGYAATPIEEALPVLCSRPRSIALLAALDRSGSMAQVVGGRAKIAWAREAVMRCAGRLREADAFGLMAFAGEPAIVLPLGPPPRAERLGRALEGIEPHGPTELEAALERALAILAPSAAQVRHAILVSDGEVTEEQAQRIRASDLSRRMARAGVTLSALLTGDDPGAAALLKDLAGASFHLVEDPANLPAVFLDELRKATYGDLLRQGVAAVRAVGAPEVARGVAPGKLSGYVRTFARPGAVAEWVVGEAGEPVLARWQFGLGRAVAFTSTVGTRWDESLWGADGLGRLWPQVVRWAARPPWPAGFEAEAAERGDEIRLTVRAEHDGRFLNGLSLLARVLPPQGAAVETPLPQTAPGEYQGAFHAPLQGAYQATIIERTKGRSLTLGVVKNDSREWEAFGVDHSALEAIARAGKGQVLAGLDGLHGVAPREVAGRLEAAWVFLTAALALFVAQVALSVLRTRRQRL